MGVQTLHPDARATDATAGLGPFGTNRGVTTALGVLLMGPSQLVGVDEFFEAVYSPTSFQSTHGLVKFGVDQPVKRRHRRAIAQMRFVLDDDRSTICSPHDHGATTSQRST